MTNSEQANKIKELKERIKELELEVGDLKEELFLKSIRKKKVAAETEQKIQRLYSYGNSMDFLAKKFELSKGTIFNIIHAD